MLKIKHPKKPVFWISDENWNKLSLKEKDYCIFLYKKRYTETEICRKLYIETESWYWRLKNRVKKVLQSDIDKINKKLV